MLAGFISIEVGTVAHPEIEYEFTEGGKRFECWTWSGGVSSSGKARVTNAAWHVRVDGNEYRTVPAGPDDLRTEGNKRDLRRAILASLREQGAID